LGIGFSVRRNPQLGGPLCRILVYATTRAPLVPRPSPSRPLASLAMKSWPEELLIVASPDAVDEVLAGARREHIDQFVERGVEQASC